LIPMRSWHSRRAERADASAVGVVAEARSEREGR
jgi:hypothetical protein